MPDSDLRNSIPPLRAVRVRPENPETFVRGGPTGAKRLNLLGQRAEHHAEQLRQDLARIRAHRGAAGRAGAAPEGAQAPLGIPARFVTTTAPASVARPGCGGNTQTAALDIAAKRREGAPARLRRRYELQDAARALLPEHRIQHCCCTPVTGRVTVHYHPEHASASYGGLQTCGSAWACPVCAAKIGARRAAEVGQAAASWRARGGHLYMLTLTLRHEDGSKLETLHDALNAAYRAVCQGRRWQLARDRYGLVGRITGREHTHGRRGWHPHLHILLFSTDDLGERIFEVERWFARRWRAELHKVGQDADLEHGTDLRRADDKAGEYIGKLARAWSVAAELAGKQEKGGRAGNRTPAQLLERAARGHERSGRLYQEYVAATAGRSWLQWTPGLRALVGLEDEQSDEQIAQEQTEQAAPMLMLEAWQWAWVRAKGLRGHLLAEACSGDAGKLAAWLEGRGLPIDAHQLHYEAHDIGPPADSG